MRALGLDKNSYVFWTTDNGAWQDVYPDAGYTPFRGTKGTVREGGNRVPAIAVWPGKIKAGVRNHEIVGGLDLLATFAAVGGAKVPENDRENKPIYFDSQDIPWEPTDFDGRSDYFGFIEAGIPAGGLFTGAEGIKSAEQAAIFGGIAGEPYDPCYHAACDTTNNINDDTLDLMADAIAHSTLIFAETTSAVNGTAKGKAVGQIDWAFKGNGALR